MKTISNKNQISLGRGYGIEILNAVKNAKKSVKIVSPYLSSSYLDELVNLNKICCCECYSMFIVFISYIFIFI